MLFGAIDGSGLGVLRCWLRCLVSSCALQEKGPTPTHTSQPWPPPLPSRRTSSAGSTSAPPPPCLTVVSRCRCVGVSVVLFVWCGPCAESKSSVCSQPFVVSLWLMACFFGLPHRNSCAPVLRRVTPRLRARSPSSSSSCTSCPSVSWARLGLAEGGSYHLFRRQQEDFHKNGNSVFFLTDAGDVLPGSVSSFI